MTRVAFNVLHAAPYYRCKIDTGCSVTAVPVRRLVDDEMAMRMKRNDIINGVPFLRSYGISDTAEKREIDSRLIDSGRLMECTALKFRHNINPLEIDGYNLGNQVVHFNYDRTGNILIGADIIKQLDIHMGMDQRTGAYTLVGCLRKAINQDYLDALYDAFGMALSMYQAKNNPYINLV